MTHPSRMKVNTFPAVLSLPSDLCSFPSMSILRHTISDRSQIQVIQHHPHNIHCFLHFKATILTLHDVKSYCAFEGTGVVQSNTTKNVV